jgi:tetratricopeptide (TPR) repeat protein
MTTAMPLQLKCPNCAVIVESRVLTSTNFLGTYTDFRRRTSGFEPLQFAVHSCGKCGFSGPEKWFEEQLTEKIRKFVDQNLKPLMRGKRSIPPWRKFEHAAQIARWKPCSPDQIADLYLSAAYVCAANGRPEEEKSNRTQAIEFFRQAIEVDGIAVEHVPSVTYLIGELYRRIGLVEDARAWFEKSEVLAEGRSELGWLVKLSRQQRTDPRDMINSVD